MTLRGVTTCRTGPRKGSTGIESTRVSHKKCAMCTPPKVDFPEASTAGPDADDWSLMSPLILSNFLYELKEKCLFKSFKN